LYAVHRAALEDAPNARRHFCHNGKVHELVTEKHRPSPGEAVRMAGSIRDPSGSEICQFNLWFDPADRSGIPNRIEFRARSFLRLTFESEPSLAEVEAALPWLIGDEPVRSG